MEGKKKVCVVGGGVGCAIALPSAKAFKEAGAEVTVIVGFRSKDIVILEDEFKAAADRLILMTDDGTYGQSRPGHRKPLQELLEAGETYRRGAGHRPRAHDEVRMQRPPSPSASILWFP